MPLVRRIPQRGVNNKFALKVVALNVCDLDAAFSDGEEVNPETLRERDILKQRYDILKILGDGELTTKLTVTAPRFSKSAQEKIEKAGGSIQVRPGRAPVIKNKMKNKS